MKKRLLLLGMAILLWATSIPSQNIEKYLYNKYPLQWAQDTAVFEQTLPVDDQWWRVFDDATLDSLIEIAVQRNYSVLSAVENMQAAKVQWRIEQGNFFPSVQLGAGWARQKSSGNVTGGEELWYGNYSATASMNWEVDVFGSIRQRATSQKQLFQASQEEYRAVMVALCAQVATAYFNFLQYEQELQVLNENCASQKNILEITEVRFHTGLASKLDVAQAKSVYFGSLASIPSIEAGVLQAKYTLAVLLSIYPDGLSQWLDNPHPLPLYVEPVGVGIPRELLRRRPDVRQAERQVASCASLLGASKSDLLPSFYLKGAFGYTSGKLKDLVERKSMTWEIAPSLSWTIFSGGRLYNATKAARIELDAAITSLNNTVLTAVQEVENAMSTYKNSIAQMTALRETVNQNIETLALSLDLYKQGLSPFQNVLDAQRSLLSSQDDLVQVQGYSLNSLVSLYKALGGGWEIQ